MAKTIRINYSIPATQFRAEEWRDDQVKRILGLVEVTETATYDTSEYEENDADVFFEDGDSCELADLLNSEFFRSLEIVQD